MSTSDGTTQIPATMPMTVEELAMARFLLGPWLIGCFLDIFLQGILFCQFARYLQWHEGDKLGIKLAVIGLAILTTLKSIQSFALIWIQLILNFADLEGAILLNYTAWWQTGNPLMVAAIGAYVQIYFCRRLYTVSKRWWIVAPVALDLAFAFASICAATYYITLGAAAGPQIALWFAAHLSSVCAGDIAMTLAMAYFLIKTKREVLPQTVGIIRALIRLTFLTSAPAALCAMFNLIFSQIYSGDDKLVSTTFNLALPKLYAMSMMWTLNARQSIRASNLKGNYSHEYATGGQRRVGRTHPNGQSNAVELGNLSVQIQTTREVTQHIDVRDMFRHKVKGETESQIEAADRIESYPTPYKA